MAAVVFPAAPPIVEIIPPQPPPPPPKIPSVSALAFIWLFIRFSRATYLLSSTTQTSRVAIL